MLRELFPHHLKQLRNKQRLTQKELAEAVGMESDRQIRKWEHGDCFPEPENLERLAKALGVHIRDLVTFPEHPDL